MEQYEKSGPPREINPQDLSQERELSELREKVRNMTLVIESLDKELRRLRIRLDEHTEHINKIKMNSK